MHKWILTLMLCLAATGVHAGDATTNPALEKRVMRLSEELRCVVCQNQTLADSQAALATDLREQVREKLASGMSDSEVRDFMVVRYGEFVLYKPPVKATTWLLWFGPFVLLVVAIGALLSKFRRRSGGVEVSDAELRRAARLLAENGMKEET